MPLNVSFIASKFSLNKNISTTQILIEMQKF